MLILSIFTTGFIQYPDYNHLYREKHLIIHFNGKQTHLFYDTGNNFGKNIIFPVKKGYQLEFYKSENIFIDIETISSTYSDFTYTPSVGKPKLLPAASQVKYLSNNEIIKMLKNDNSIRQNEILRTIDNYSRAGFRFLDIPCSADKRLIKITFQSLRPYIPVEIYRLNRNLSIINNQYFILTDYKAVHPILSTEFALRFFTGKKPVNALTSYPLNALSKVVPEIKDKIVHLTRLHSYWIRKFCNQDIELSNDGQCPGIFSKQYLVSLKAQEYFNPARKLFYNQFLFTPDSANAEEIEYFFKIWKAGEFNQNFLITQWKNFDVFKYGLPELLVVDIINRSIKIKRWAFINAVGTRMLRLTIPDKPGYRIIFTRNISKKGLSMVLSGYKRMAGKFHGEFLVFTNDKRVIVVRKTTAGLFAYDYNAYRLSNWDNSDIERIGVHQIVINMKNALSKISVQGHELDYMRNYFTN